MNREDRRTLKKNGASEETISKLSAYDKPCTVLEVVKLARAIAEDVATQSLEEYRRLSTGTIVSMTLQLEILKSVVINAGLIKEEDFQLMYETAAKEFEDKQREYLNAMKEAEATRLQDNEVADSSVVDFNSVAHPVEVKILKEDKS